MLAIAISILFFLADIFVNLLKKLNEKPYLTAEILMDIKLVEKNETQNSLVMQEAGSLIRI